MKRSGPDLLIEETVIFNEIIYKLRSTQVEGCANEIDNKIEERWPIYLWLQLSKLRCN